MMFLIVEITLSKVVVKNFIAHVMIVKHAMCSEIIVRKTISLNVW